MMSKISMISPRVKLVIRDNSGHDATMYQGRDVEEIIYEGANLELSN